MLLILAGAVWFTVWIGVPLLLAINSRVNHIGENSRDCWIGSLPTIAPGDTNRNPIHKEVDENGNDCYWRNR